jgi:hypothetical protein
LSRSTWRPLCGGNNYSVPFALCFYSHSRGARLVARCIMRSVLIRARGAAIFRAAFLEGRPSSLAQSPTEIRSAIGQRKPWSSATLGLPRRFFCQSIFTSSVLHGLSFKLPPPAFGCDARCRADRRPLRLPTGGARAPQAFWPLQPPLVSLRSYLPERLSSVRGV